MDSEKRQQLELLPKRSGPHVEPLTESLVAQIRRKRTFLHAWNFGQDFADLESKECYQPLGIDSSHWTKIRNGTGSPPAKSFNAYLDLIENEFPLIWWAESRGYDWMTIRKHESAEQRRIRELEERNQLLETENRDLRRSFVVAYGQGR